MRRDGESSLAVHDCGDVAGSFFSGVSNPIAPGFPIYPNFACAMTISKDGLLAGNCTLSENFKLTQQPSGTLTVDRSLPSRWHDSLRCLRSDQWRMFESKRLCGSDFCSALAFCGWQSIVWISVLELFGPREGMRSYSSPERSALRIDPRGVGSDHAPIDNVAAAHFGEIVAAVCLHENVVLDEFPLKSGDLAGRGHNGQDGKEASGSARMDQRRPKRVEGALSLKNTSSEDF
jgi:hypothetical protein